MWLIWPGKSMSLEPLSHYAQWPLQTFCTWRHGQMCKHEILVHVSVCDYGVRSLRFYKGQSCSRCYRSQTYWTRMTRIPLSSFTFFLLGGICRRLWRSICTKNHARFLGCFHETFRVQYFFTSLHDFFRWLCLCAMFFTHPCATFFWWPSVHFLVCFFFWQGDNHARSIDND